MERERERERERGNNAWGKHPKGSHWSIVPSILPWCASSTSTAWRIMRSFWRLPLAITPSWYSFSTDCLIGFIILTGWWSRATSILPVSESFRVCHQIEEGMQLIGLAGYMFGGILGSLTIYSLLCMFLFFFFLWLRFACSCKKMIRALGIYYMHVEDQHLYICRQAVHDMEAAPPGVYSCPL